MDIFNSYVSLPEGVVFIYDGNDGVDIMGYHGVSLCCHTAMIIINIWRVHGWYDKRDAIWDDIWDWKVFPTGNLPVYELENDHD